MSNSKLAEYIRELIRFYLRVRRKIYISLSFFFDAYTLNLKVALFMKIEVYNVCNPNAKVKVNPIECVKQAFVETDVILKILGDIRPEIKTEYISALKKRLVEAIRDSHIDSSLFDFNEMGKELTVLNKYSELQEMILQLVCKYLALPEDYRPGPEKIEVLSLNNFKADARPSYYRVKTFVDVLGEDAGVKLWKEIINRKLVEERTKSGGKEVSVREVLERSMKRWMERGLADFTAAIFDDHKVLFRFDRCLIAEALKDFNDPDIAYLATCFVGEAGVNTGRTMRLRRTQTLHHRDFCDEFYWDIEFYTDPEQPSLEFTRKMGRN